MLLLTLILIFSVFSDSWVITRTVLHHIHMSQQNMYYSHFQLQL